MSLRSRRLLFAFFVLLFCLLVPIVLLYATGNTINWRRFTLEKTGSILVDSSPEGAVIFLDGKALSANPLGWLGREGLRTTKTNLKNILPGEHRLRLEREGYWPWEGRFSLSPDEALNLGTIRLFKKAEPVLLAPEATKHVMSPSGNSFILINEGSLTFFNAVTETSKSLIAPRNLTKAAVEWSANENAASIDSLIVHREEGVVFDLNTAAENKAALVRWNSSDPTLVYFMDETHLRQYNVATTQTVALDLDSIIATGDRLIDYRVSGQNAYFIIENSNGAFIRYGRFGATLENLSLPRGSYRLLSSFSGRPALSNGKNVYLIDEPLPLFPRPRLLEIADFKIGRFQGDDLFYATSFELRRWRSQGDTVFLTRFGSPINALWPIENGNSVLVATADDLRVYSLGREPFILILSPAEDISSLTAVNGKTAYFYGRFNGIMGLYKLEF